MIYIGFVASYTYVNGGMDRIRSYYSPAQRCNGVVCTTPSFVAVKTVENSAGSAYVKAQSDVSTAFSSWNVWVTLYVGRDTMSVVQS